MKVWRIELQPNLVQAMATVGNIGHRNRVVVGITRHASKQYEGVGRRDSCA